LIRIGDGIAQDSPIRRSLSSTNWKPASAGLLQRLAYALVPRHEGSGIWRIVHGAYLIFYRIDSDQVTIIHDIHGAMDYDALLFPEA
jgi:toxin ParE1/3/4